MADNAPQYPADPNILRSLPALAHRDVNGYTLASQAPSQLPSTSSLPDQPTVAPGDAVSQHSGPPAESASPASGAILAGQDQWYYARGKQKVGPLSWPQLRTEAHAGRVPSDAMVLREGTSKWVSAATVPGLFPASASLPDHPPAPIPERLITQVTAAGGSQPPSSRDQPRNQATEAVTVPGYEVLGELGRGGMGVVYKARQVGLNRTVALKMILVAECAGGQDRARFKAEGEAVARLQHPNVVQIHEVGEHDDRPFFSMEFVDGGSLAHKARGGPLPPRAAAGLVETLARAMHAAHEYGVVHRDLKPANVLLSADGTPKIADFGLAKRLDVDAGQTRTGSVLGTPSYMAPEQADGRTKEVGPAADVYALGAILYELLTGRPPFKGETAMHTLFQVLSVEPVPPARLRTGVPADLNVICLKCLEKNPRDRYASAAALAEDLRRFLNGEVIAARPAGPWKPPSGRGAGPRSPACSSASSRWPPWPAASSGTWPRTTARSWSSWTTRRPPSRFGSTVPSSTARHWRPCYGGRRAGTSCPSKVRITIASVRSSPSFAGRTLPCGYSCRPSGPSGCCWKATRRTRNWRRRILRRRSMGRRSIPTTSSGRADFARAHTACGSRGRRPSP